MVFVHSFFYCWRRDKVRFGFLSAQVQEKQVPPRLKSRELAAVMYADWASLEDEIEHHKGNQSVLHKFNPVVGRDVACTVVRNIAANVSIPAANEDPSTLEDEKDVKWTMEVSRHILLAFVSLSELCFCSIP